MPRDHMPWLAGLSIDHVSVYSNLPALICPETAHCVLERQETVN